MENKVSIVAPAGLYHRYPAQTQRQPCYVELDCAARTLGAEWNPEIGNAVPAPVWHRHVLRWDIPALRDDAAETLLKRLAPLAQRICDGYTSEWDGHNHVACYTEAADTAARAAEFACEEIGDDDCVRAWDCADWCASQGDDAVRRDLGITSTSTDADLDAAVARLESDAENVDEVDLLEGTDRYVRHLRDTAPEI